MSTELYLSPYLFSYRMIVGTAFEGSVRCRGVSPVAGASPGPDKTTQLVGRLTTLQWLSHSNNMLHVYLKQVTNIYIH